MKLFALPTNLLTLGLCAVATAQSDPAVAGVAATHPLAEAPVMVAAPSPELRARPGAAFAIVASPSDAASCEPMVVLGYGRVGDDGSASLLGIIPRPHGREGGLSPEGLIPRPHNSPAGGGDDLSLLGIIPRPHGREGGLSPEGLIPRPHSSPSGGGDDGSSSITILVRAVVFDGAVVESSAPVSLVVPLR